MERNIKIFTDVIDGKAINQVYELADLKAFEGSKIRIMSDAHVGKGCVVGFTGTYTDKIIPNIVGSDICCGMLLIELGKIDIDLPVLDEFIKENIPMGRSWNTKSYKNREMTELRRHFEAMHCYPLIRNKEVIMNSVGSLGGGNHFIEIDEDDEGNKYLVIHSGSRNLGTQVARVYQEIAYKECCATHISQDEIRRIAKDLKRQGRQREIPDAIKKYQEEKQAKEPGLDKDICYLEGESMQNYLEDILVCREFANMSRRYMAERILEAIFTIANKGRKNVIEMPKDVNGYINSDITDVGYDDDELNVHLGGFETLHNYVDVDAKIIRKGAIRALKGERVLIPINMRDGSLLCTGLGNDDWNFSAPHGAGRLMSRSEAKEKVNLEDFRKTMKDVYTTSVNDSTIDESPFVYKSMDDILRYVTDTAHIDKIIKPIYNCKASNVSNIDDENLGGGIE